MGRQVCKRIIERSDDPSDEVGQSWCTIIGVVYGLFSNCEKEEVARADELADFIESFLSIGHADLKEAALALLTVLWRGIEAKEKMMLKEYGEKPTF